MIRKELLVSYGQKNPDDGRDVVIGSGASPDFQVPDKAGRANIKDLEWYFWNYGPLFRALNLKAASLWGRGFKIVCDDEEIRKKCEKITLKMPGFKRWCILETLHGLAFGSGPGEIIWDDVNQLDEKGNVMKDHNDFIIKESEGKNIIGYNVTDYKTFFPKWDTYGTVKFWKQKVNTSSGVTIETNHMPRKIVQFKFYQVADNFNGIGLVETNLGTIRALKTAEKSSNDLLFRHGVPFVHIKKIGATAKEVPKLSKIGAKFNSSTHLASSEKITLELKGVEGKSVDIKPHIDQLQDNFCGGIGVPKPIVFFAGETVNRATLTELLSETSAEIKMNQEILSDIIEIQILKPYLEAQGIGNEEDFPQVVWNPLDEKGEKEVLENLKLLSESLAKLVQVGVFSPEEAKEYVEKRIGLEK